MYIKYFTICYIEHAKQRYKTVAIKNADSVWLAPEISARGKEVGYVLLHGNDAQTMRGNYTTLKRYRTQAEAIAALDAIAEAISRGERLYDLTEEESKDNDSFT